ncbi:MULTISPECIES: hypothetical protein [unclassified Natrinema]|uniref:hypothetical protein n=1 Tax=unclassified Natrinema TaxID=2622230 RepID=UPI001E4BDAEC|nr:MULTISPECIES: hypothetical protein [unclassified Natrinema]
MSTGTKRTRTADGASTGRRDLETALAIGSAPASEPTGHERPMKRTRRAALALIAGSSSVLAVETAGFSSADADRDVRVAPASDATGYLGLTEDGVEDDGVLFGGGPRHPPVRFDLSNQCPASLTVALTVDPFRLQSADGESIDGTRFVIDGGTGGLGPGERVDAVTIGVPPDSVDSGETITGLVAIDARGDDIRIEAERELTLAVPDTGSRQQRSGTTGQSGSVPASNSSES